MNEFKMNGEMLINIKPSYTITVYNADGEVGRLDFSGTKLIFTGDAEESANVFINNLALGWTKRLQEEPEAEREACAKACEDLREFFSGTSLAVDYENHSPSNSLAYTQCAAPIRARSEA